MYEYIIYILTILTILLFFIYAYIRYKYGFWIIQPVFHFYDVSYYVKPPGIIESSLPQKNKYTNFTNIETKEIAMFSDIQKQRFIHFIQTHYLQNNNNTFSPQSQNIISYFIGHNQKSYISMYNIKNNIYNTNSQNIIVDDKMIGVITSRPLNVFIIDIHSQNNKHNKLIVYYVDYLCVDKQHRKKGIAPQLIQTHHYNQRYSNKNICVSLFKREDELTGIVPICAYSTYGFSVNKWTKPNELLKEYTILDINTQNFYIFYDFIQQNKTQFKIIILPDVSNLLELIKTKNIFISTLLCDKKIVACYFFRKTCVEIEKDLEVLSCFASICNCDQNIFIQGFKISFWKIAYDNHFGFSAIENISHNDIIINNIIIKTKPYIVSPTAYYFYNFAYPSFPSNQSLIIN